MTLNEIQADEKEPKMLTKGQVHKHRHIAGGSNETFYYCSWPSRREGIRCWPEARNSL
jgi:hypothetical protein